MAHLSPAEIVARRQAISQDILAGVANSPGFQWYFLQCPCRIDCECVPEETTPRIILANCPYPGELDYFYTHPFKNHYGFITAWHCRECESEFACGISK